ncbi:related to MFS transporter [Phialocephala subalpina]|uniref:Related to MFS transporter n=1 Tax=Phialocephala subalpina TaxID=576137 RepID=A0A1L7XNC1_9HELO|nr:related to MFS transporter [Phialocephala subalpina]
MSSVLNAEQQARLTTERDLHVEMLPGTELLEDVGNLHRIHAHNVANSTVLVPQPSSSPDDPLNWSPKWKTIIMVNQCVFVALSIMPSQCIAPLSPIFEAQWNKNATQVALLTGVMVIALGYTNFVIIPCAHIFGRRPTMIVCCIITLATDIWMAAAGSYWSFMAARLINGFGTGANESMLPLVVADIYAFFIGLMIGPIIAGNIAARVSWRWFFWVCVIAQAINLLGLIVAFPETRFNRDQPPTLAQEASQEASDNEKSPQATAEVENQNVFVTDESLEHGKPSRKQFNIIQGIDRKALSEVWIHLWTPVEIFFYPIVCWAAWTMAGAANAFLLLVLFESPILSNPPYNFSSANIGFANFAPAVGCVIALLVCGPFCDWVALRATKKNHGVFEPEMRLPALIPFLAISLIGLLALGIGGQDKWPWEAIIIVGFGFFGFLTVSLPTVAITYAIDCYKPISGQIMVTSTVVKNTFGFGMTYYINDWIVRDGFIPATGLVIGLAIALPLVGMIGLMIWGKDLRRLTKNSKYHQF